jgi:hypothetical protein
MSFVNTIFVSTEYICCLTHQNKITIFRNIKMNIFCFSTMEILHYNGNVQTKQKRSFTFILSNCRKNDMIICAKQELLHE